jgi:serine/threonine-protein kinase HipA
MPTTNARVNLWGKQIGAVSWLEDREIGVFQYVPDFLKSGIEISPLLMPLRETPYEFPSLSKQTFKGLPGLLADSLPDKYGNIIINEWLASQGRTPESFNPVERLCYTGKRGMGALEYEPSTISPVMTMKPLDVEKLVDLANRVLAKRVNFGGEFSDEDDREAVMEILRVGTSAGGARAKAILAWNPKTKEFRSGQVDIKEGFEHWIMKFDGITNNRDKELADPLGYGMIEYTYHLIALEIGIKMSVCLLHNEGGRSHFMTRRFDRTLDGKKIHMQSLGALAHFDYNQSASYSYEQAIVVMKKLQLPREDLIQQVLRSIFNLVGRNHDDHVKNIAFLMNRNGDWRLSPAFDITYAWNPIGSWTNRHQMSINGKREDIDREDILKLSNFAGLKNKQCNKLIDEVIVAFDKWPDFAKKVGVVENQISQIEKQLLLDL